MIWLLPVASPISSHLSKVSISSYLVPAEVLHVFHCPDCEFSSLKGDNCVGATGMVKDGGSKVQGATDDLLLLVHYRETVGDHLNEDESYIDEAHTALDDWHWDTLSWNKFKTGWKVDQSWTGNISIEAITQVALVHRLATKLINIKSIKATCLPEYIWNQNTVWSQCEEILITAKHDMGWIQCQ